jgi:hypothetical protein
MTRYALSLLFLLFSAISIGQDISWVKTFGAAGIEQYGGVSATPDGGFVHFVSFSSNVTIGDSNYSTQGIFVYDFLLYKTDDAGNVLWSKHMPGSGDQFARDVDVDQTTGRIALYGRLGATMSVDGIALNAQGIAPVLIVLDSAGTALWGETFPGNNVLPHEVKFTAAGDLLMTGEYRNQVSIDTASYQKFDPLNTIQARNPFIAKYSAAGTYLWSNAFPVSFSANVVFAQYEGYFVSLAEAPNGDIFLGINFRDLIRVDGDTITGTSNFSEDILILELSSTGQVDSTIFYGGTGQESINDIEVDANGRVYIAGSTTGNVTIAGTLIPQLSSAGFLAEITNGGTLLQSTGGEASAAFLALDLLDNVYMTGYYSGSTSFGSFSFPQTFGSGTQSFILKYDQVSQTWEWVKSFDAVGTTSLNHYYTQMAVRAEDDLVVSGNFDATLRLNNTNYIAAGLSDNILVRILNCDGLNASISSNVGSACNATSALLTAASDSAYTYSWFGNGTSIPNSNASTFNAIVAGNYFVVVDSAGCTDTSNVFTLSSTGSSLNVSFSALSSICENDSQFSIVGGSPVGGIYSGPGVNNGFFDPSLASLGSNVLKYVYTDTNTGCSDSATQTIVVNAAPFILMLPLDTTCSNQTPITLNVGFPTGGTYSGSGVTGSSFDPSQVSFGSNTIFYTRSNANCSATDSVLVEVVSPPQISFSINSPLCENASPVALSATPSGGNFSGNGVSGNFLVPQLLNAGTNTIIYSATGNGCTSSTTASVFIDTLPAAGLSVIPSVCESVAPIDLQQYASSFTGIFLGNGVSATGFNPSIAGAGIHTISYVISNSCGSDTATQTIEVFANPIVTFPALADLCLDQSLVSLSSATPLGGVYSGTGVLGSSFDPAVAGAGTFNLNYGFADSNGCSDSANSSITVNDLPIVSLDTLGGICENRVPFALNIGSPSGGTYSGSGASAGMFNPSLVAVGNYNLTYQFTDANGCSNSDNVQVEVRATFEDTLVHVSCDSFTTSLGNTYYSSGIYIDSLLSLGSCDSVIVRNVTINQSTIDTIPAVVCDSFTSVTNQVYTTSGVYFDTLTNVFGCDSVIRTELTVNTFTTETISPVVCDQYISLSGQVLTVSGVYTDSLTNTNGCDSILTINLTINNSTLDTIQPVACDSYTSPANQILTSTGTYFDTLSTVNNCDSVIRIELTIFNAESDTNTITNCVSYTSAGGVTYAASGVFTESYSNADGCDSTVVENVTILNPTSSSISPIVCDSYTSPSGKTLTSSGSYSDTLTNAVGCDSIITIQLQVNPSYLDTVFVTACDSAFNAISNQWITTSGIYVDSLISVSGCDSVWITHAIINQSTTNAVQVTTCDSFVSPAGNTYFASLVFSDTFVAANNCDSIVTYNVTINNSVTQTIPVISCDSFSSPAGLVYTSSGVFTENFSTTLGCDSTVNYDVTINSSQTTLVTEIACDSFTSPSGMVYSFTGIFDEVLATTDGCDSTVSYDVTINFSVSDIIQVVACDSFTSPFGTVYNTSGSFTELAATSNGCDSLVTYEVEINPTKYSTVVDTACGIYQTPLGSIYTSSGIYSDTATTVAGCDSIIMYDLTIGQPDTMVANETSCGPFTSAWGEVFEFSGTYADTSFTSLGCDSIKVLNLTISEVDPSITAYVTSLVANADSNESTFQWLVCTDPEVQLIGVTTATFFPTISGPYALEVTNQDNCVDTSACVYFQKLGVESLNKISFKVFPNPTKGDLNIQFDQLLPNVEIEVRNSLGQMILQERYSNSQNLNLQIKGAAGIYFLKIISEGDALDYRVVVE